MGSWRLVRDVVLPFGQLGVCAVIHVRVYEAGPDVMPVVIAGQFGDYRGQSITNAIEDAAAAVQSMLYPQGRPFRLIEHYPFDSFYEHNPWPRFKEVTFYSRKRVSRFRRWMLKYRAERDARFSAATTVVTAEGSIRHQLIKPAFEDQVWRFEGPRWRPLTLAWSCEDLELQAQIVSGKISETTTRLPDVFGEMDINIWPKELYTPALIGGPEAEELAQQRYQACRRRVDVEAEFITALTNPPPGAIVTLYEYPTNTRNHFRS